MQASASDFGEQAQNLPDSPARDDRVLLVTRIVSAAWFSLFAVVALTFPFERRWSAVRVMLQSLMLAIALFLIAAARAWDEFDKANPLTWLFTFGLALLLAASVVLYAMMEIRCRERRRSP